MAAADVIAFVNQLGIPTYADARRRELIEYGLACGLDALKRQLEHGRRLYRCCWEPNDGDHHPLCSTGRKAA